VVSLIVGVSYGAVAGYLGGRIDNFMMRVVDIIYAIPYILIVIVLLNAFGGPNTAVLVGALPVIFVMIVGLIALAFVGYQIYGAVFGEGRKMSAGLSLILNIVFYAAVILGVAAVVWASLWLNGAVLGSFGEWLA